MGVGSLNAASISVAGRAASEMLLRARLTELIVFEAADALAEAEDCGRVDASMRVLSGAEERPTRRSARVFGAEHFAGAETRHADGR